MTLAAVDSTMVNMILGSARLSQRERLHAHRVKVEALRVAVVWIVIALYQILESIEAGRTPAKKFMDKLRKPRGAVVLAAKRQCRLSPDQSFGL